MVLGLLHGKRSGVVVELAVLLVVLVELPVSALSSIVKAARVFPDLTRYLGLGYLLGMQHKLIHLYHLHSLSLSHSPLDPGCDTLVW